MSVPGNMAQTVTKSESFKRVKCPRCGKRLKVPRLAHAQRLRCIRCGAQFRLRGDAGLTPLREGLGEKEVRPPIEGGEYEEWSVRAKLVETLDAHAREIVDALLALVEDEPSFHRRLARLGDEVRAVKEREVHLVVTGEFSTGKSTFVNALIGDKLLPMKTRPTTARPCYLHYGIPQRCEIATTDGRRIRADLSELSDYLDQKGKKKNIVDEVHVWLDSDALRDGVTLVDTPGLNVEVKSHLEATDDARRRSDAIVYLFDTRNLGKATEIKDIRRQNWDPRKLFFIVNKIDVKLDDQEERDQSLGSFLTDCATDLGRHFDVPADQIRLFPVSSLWALKKIRSETVDGLLGADYGFRELKENLWGFARYSKNRQALSKSLEFIARETEDFLDREDQEFEPGRDQFQEEEQHLHRIAQKLEADVMPQIERAAAEEFSFWLDRKTAESSSVDKLKRAVRKGLQTKAQALLQPSDRNSITCQVCQSAWRAWIHDRANGIVEAATRVARRGNHAILSYLQRVNVHVVLAPVRPELDEGLDDLALHVFPDADSLGALLTSIWEWLSPPTADDLAKKAFNRTWPKIAEAGVWRAKRFADQASDSEQRCIHQLRKAVHSARVDLREQANRVRGRRREAERGFRDRYESKRSTIIQIRETLLTLVDLRFLLENVDACRTDEFKETQQRLVQRHEALKRAVAVREEGAGEPPANPRCGMKIPPVLEDCHPDVVMPLLAMLRKHHFRAGVAAALLVICGAAAFLVPTMGLGAGWVMGALACASVLGSGSWLLLGRCNVCNKRRLRALRRFLEQGADRAGPAAEILMLLSRHSVRYGREARRLLPEISDSLVSSETAARYLKASAEEMENLASNNCLRSVVKGEEMVQLKDVLDCEKL